LLVARLQADLSFPSEAARVQAFIAAGAGEHQRPVAPHQRCESRVVALKGEGL
jgi:hypothetical protein